jgi:ribosomal protein S18 acetylase RimI-like enzyme
MNVAFRPAQPEDLERLTALKLEVMNPQLERIGRLDPVRSAARFAQEFRPGVTRLILRDGQFAGCVTLHQAGAEWVMEHFYLQPAQQGRGLGDAAMRRLLAEVDAAGADIRLSVLVDGDANGFYPRYGFVETHREAFDIYYRRSAASR